MLQEMKSFFFKGEGTPNVWLMTAFWTGSICQGAGGQNAGSAQQWVGMGCWEMGHYKTPKAEQGARQPRTPGFVCQRETACLFLASKFCQTPVYFHCPPGVCSYCFHLQESQTTGTGSCAQGGGKEAAGRVP